MPDEIRAIACSLTFACATDGNRGRSVAQGAQLMGADAVSYVHSGVSDGRVQAIARFGAQMIRMTFSKGGISHNPAEAIPISGADLLLDAERVSSAR